MTLRSVASARRHEAPIGLLTRKETKMIAIRKSVAILAAGLTVECVAIVIILHLIARVA